MRFNACCTPVVFNSADGPPPLPPVPIARSVDEEAGDAVSGFAGNPELQVVYNPRGRRRRSRFNMGVRGRRKMRTAKNLPLTIKHGRHKVTWRSLTKKLGPKKAARVWRQGKKFHGYTRTRVGGNSVKRKRKYGRNPTRKFIRLGGKKVSWKGLVRRKGVMGAKKLWRKHKKVGRAGRTYRRKARRRVCRKYGRTTHGRRRGRKVCRKYRRARGRKKAAHNPRRRRSFRRKSRR